MLDAEGLRLPWQAFQEFQEANGQETYPWGLPEFAASNLQTFEMLAG